MNELRFKTNINCANCMAKVTPLLNSQETIQKWEVNLNDPDRILTVSTNKLSSGEITDLIKKVGFKAEVI